MKLFINILIFIFSFLIIRCLYINIKQSLEGFCSTSGDSKSACSAIANSENSASSNYTTKLIADTKKELGDLMTKVSKSAMDSQVKIQKNTQGIAKNLKRKNQIKAEIEPDE